MSFGNGYATWDYPMSQRDLVTMEDLEAGTDRMPTMGLWWSAYLAAKGRQMDTAITVESDNEKDDIEKVDAEKDNEKVVIAKDAEKKPSTKESKADDDEVYDFKVPDTPPTKRQKVDDGPDSQVHIITPPKIFERVY